MMIPGNQQAEYDYRFNERLGILTDGRREPTGDETRMASEEASEFVLDLERQELVARVFALSMEKKFERNLKRRFGK